MENYRGLFVTFEGIEGSGKTTQAKLLADAIGESKVVLTREPGGTPLAEEIRNIFLSSNDLALMTELLLINSARRQHVNDIILPALTEFRTVVCDRFTDSTMVYQGYVKGMEEGVIHYLNQIATVGLVPDLTFVLDIPPEVALERIEKANHFDRESLDFHCQVRDAYLKIAQSDMRRIRVIDSTLPKDAVHKAILREYELEHKFFLRNFPTDINSLC